MAGEADVIVIGAGLAGLAAASELCCAGQEVIVLESRLRVGGRLHTDREAGYPLELGAQVLHSPETNPLVPVARARGMRLVRSDFSDYRVYDGPDPLPDDEVRAAMRAFAEVLERAVRVGSDITVLAAMERCGLREAFRGRERLLRWALASAAVFSGAELDRISVRFFEDAGEYEKPALAAPDGLDRLLGAFVGALGPRTLRFGETVASIDHGEEIVRVRTGARSYAASRAIVTLPLGVLRSGAVRFDPPLPARKRLAIERLGMGTLDFVHLEFPRAFWPADREFVGVLDARWPRFADRSRLLGRPVLTAAIGADAAREGERRPDEAVIAEALEALRRAFAVEEPVRAIVTRWAADRSSMGSYSHLPRGADAEDRAALAEPVHDRLFFAGEATHEREPGTLQGAYLSGLREAARLGAPVRA